MLYGFSQVIFQGAVVTLELALSSVVLAVLIGLVGAGAKLSRNRVLALIFEGYTTLIRGVPDLVLMLLIFYGLQMALNVLTDALGLAQFDIDPMIAGIITLGFIYGAYFTETFRGAILSVPRGQVEAAQALGLSKAKITFKIVLPQAIRFIIPSLISQLVVVVKDTTVAYVVSYPDLMQNARVLITNYDALVSVYLVIAVIYILINVAINKAAVYVSHKTGATIIR